MTRRWWFLRWSSAAHIPTWASDELEQFAAALRTARDESRIGPVPPPDFRSAGWPAFDRQAES